MMARPSDCGKSNWSESTGSNNLVVLIEFTYRRRNDNIFNRLINSMLRHHLSVVVVVLLLLLLVVV